MIRSGSPPRRRRRAATVTALVVTSLVGGALPAFGHAQIPGSLNPLGDTEATAYPGGSGQVVIINADNEAGPNDTSQLDIRIPTGWSATCTGATVRSVTQTQDGTVVSPSTGLTNWTCGEVSLGGAPHLQFSNSAPASNSIIGGFRFRFTVTTPSPTTTTSYGTGAVGSGNQGWKAVQSYATGQRNVWHTPNEAPDGPAAENTSVDTLVRWVAGPTSSPTPTPEPSTEPTPVPTGEATPTPTPVPTGEATPTPTPGTTPTTVGAQSISAQIPAAPAEFSISFAGTAVALTAGEATSTYLPFSGALNAITLKDTRTGGPAWSVSGVTGDFASSALTLPDSARYLGWAPKITSAGAGAVAGSAIAGALDAPPGVGLKTPQGLATAPGSHALGSAVLGADLGLRLPTGIPGGSYSSVLTITAI